MPVSDSALSGSDRRCALEHLAGLGIVGCSSLSGSERSKLRPSETWGCTFRLCGDRLEYVMKWRVVLELVGADGAVSVCELGGGAAVAEYAPRTIGLRLAEGKQILAETQRHLVQAQTDEHCRRRRVCQRCQFRRPVKDLRSRRLVSLFGNVTVKASRFKPCPCVVTCGRTLNPVAEIMPDRCTPEYERMLAKMGRCCRIAAPEQ